MTVSIISSHAHALVLPGFVADIAELVDGPVNTLVPDVVGLALVVVLHALRAIICAVSRVECRGGAAYHDFHAAFIFLFFFFVIHFGIVNGPLHVADNRHGIQGRAFIGAHLVRNIVFEADMVGADTHSHLILELE